MASSTTHFRMTSVALLLGAALLAQTGCIGPVISTKRIADAETAVERARVADAHERAPYEYYLAEEYLHKAKEEWGYSDFQASERYATEARRQAERSLTKAKEDPFTGSPVPQDKLTRAKSSDTRLTPARERVKEDPADILEDVNTMDSDGDGI